MLLKLLKHQMDVAQATKAVNCCCSSYESIKMFCSFKICEKKMVVTSIFGAGLIWKADFGSYE